MTDTEFVAPRAGEWRSFAEHFPDAPPLLYQRIIRETLAMGMRTNFARYGMPADHVELEFVQGHAYLHAAPLIDSGGRSLPPAPVLWLAARLHPVFRRREKAARRTLAERTWLADTRRWFTEQRPQWIARNRALQRVDLTSLDDAGLVDHLRRCEDNATDGYRLHFELHAPDMLPAGMLLARAEDWGLDRGDVSAALAGASPVSRGADPELDRLRTIVSATDPPPASLDDVRALGPEAEGALDAYLDDHGWRLISRYDVTGATLGELPNVVLQRILAPARPSTDPAHAEHTAAAMRAQVPEVERSEFDRLLADTRATCELRDDNGQFTGSWPMGLLRRALLECGRRLAARDALAEAAHVFELETDETTALLVDKQGPNASEVTTRVTERKRQSALVPPDTLGPPEPAPPFRALPRGLAIFGRAILATLEGLTTVPDSVDGALYGAGVGTAVYCGRAVVARRPEEAFERLQPGDVLVAMTTTPAYNAVLPLAGALVVEAGGYLSHAAVMARELNLPAVIGATGAMATISDGDTVEVDPANGRVRVIAAASTAAPV